MAFDLSELMKDVSRPDTGREQISYLPYASLIPDPNNGYSMNGLEELARSIEVVGLQQPLRVKELGAERYGIISGHRRHAAIGLILQNDPAAFPEGVPCIVDRAGGSVAMRELQLLLANADNRKLTSADEAQQAERISDCLRKLEDEGYVFPGRHRDWVSKLSGLSRTKLARLNVIKTKLDPKLKREAYDKGQMTEEAAYELARLPEGTQRKVIAWYKSRGMQPSAWYSGRIKDYAADIERLSTIKCPAKFGGGPCVNQPSMLEEIWKHGCQSYTHCGSGKNCCSSCASLATCGHVCGYMLPKAEQLRQERRTKNKEMKAAQEAAEQPLVERIRAIWLRFGNALGRANMEDEELRKITGHKIFQLDADQITALEAGEPCKKLKAGTVLPFYNSGYLSEIERYIKTADALDCSLDYLFCRTDVPEVNRGVVADCHANAAAMTRNDSEGVVPAWQTGDPPGDGVYCCRLQGPNRVLMSLCRRCGEDWLLMTSDHVTALPCLGWWPVPEKGEGMGGDKS